MFDAKKLLDQVMGAAQGGNLGQLGSQLGLGGGQAQGNAAQPQSGMNAGQLATGALAGGVLGLLIGNKKTRKMLGKGAGTALKVGGLAAVAGLAYTAYKRHQAGQAAPAPQQVQLPPADSGFAPEQAQGGANNLAQGVLVAMIQAAKADGHIDAEEHARIFGHLDTLGLDAEAKAFVVDELGAPLDMARVTAHATSPEVAAELYAASLLAMDPDTPEERAYLNRLAQALGLEAGLAMELEKAVAETR
ncbi:MAG: tellurite resistance TerB family protein [Rhodobacteraceae bacterium]|nr:tellurite resistance TerB family protein [Paracoccaceae bacterium]